MFGLCSTAVCKYDRGCYRKRASHFQEYAHPCLVAQQGKSRSQCLSELLSAFKPHVSRSDVVSVLNEQHGHYASAHWRLERVSQLTAKRRAVSSAAASACASAQPAAASARASAQADSSGLSSRASIPVAGVVPTAVTTAVPTALPVTVPAAAPAPAPARAAAPAPVASTPAHASPDRPPGPFAAASTRAVGVPLPAVPPPRHVPTRAAAIVPIASASPAPPAQRVTLGVLGGPAGASVNNPEEVNPGATTQGVGRGRCSASTVGGALLAGASATAQLRGSADVAKPSAPRRPASSSQCQAHRAVTHAGTRGSAKAPPLATYHGSSSAPSQSSGAVAVAAAQTKNEAATRDTAVSAPPGRAVVPHDNSTTPSSATSRMRKTQRAEDSPARTPTLSGQSSPPSSPTVPSGQMASANKGSSGAGGAHQQRRNATGASLWCAGCDNCIVPDVAHVGVVVQPPPRKARPNCPPSVHGAIESRRLRRGSVKFKEHPDHAKLRWKKQRIICSECENEVGLICKKNYARKKLKVGARSALIKHKNVSVQFSFDDGSSVGASTSSLCDMPPWWKLEPHLGTSASAKSVDRSKQLTVSALEAECGSYGIPGSRPSPCSPPHGSTAQPSANKVPPKHVQRSNNKRKQSQAPTKKQSSPVRTGRVVNVVSKGCFVALSPAKTVFVRNKDLRKYVHVFFFFRCGEWGLAGGGVIWVTPGVCVRRQGRPSTRSRRRTMPKPLQTRQAQTTRAVPEHHNACRSEKIRH